LHVGASGFGLLRAAPAVGDALGAAWLVRHPIERNAGRWLLWCVCGFGIFTVVFGLSRSMPLSLLALALTGGFDMVSMVLRNTLTQMGVPEAMRGRVGAVENVFIGASNELGMFESVIVIALWSRLFPELRSFDRLSEHYRSS